MYLGAQVNELRNGWAFGKNRVYECVNLLGGAIWADFVPKCFIIVWRAGRVSISPTFLHMLSALIGVQSKSGRETHELNN